MLTYTPIPGESINEAADEAIILAVRGDEEVHLDFNGVDLYINKSMQSHQIVTNY